MEQYQKNKLSKLKLRRIVFVVALCSLLIFSLGINYILFKKAISYYRDINELRLDPLETRLIKKSSKLEKSKKDHPLIVLYGDSRISEWSPIFELPGWTVVNRGIRGQTTNQLWLRLQKDVIIDHPKVVVLQGGINDLKNIGLFPERRNNIIKDCQQNLLNIIQMMERHQIYTVVLTIFPTGKPSFFRSFFWSSETSDAITEINDFLLSIDGSRVSIIDSDKILSDGQYVFSKFKRDMLHINSKGYKQFNGYLQKNIGQLVTR